MIRQMPRPIGWFALTFVAALLAINASFAAAQSPTCGQWLVPVTRISANGDFVAGLSPSDLELGRSSESIQLLSTAPESRPRRIVILVDISGSMASPSSGSWSLTAQFLHDLASVDSPNVSFALLLFSDHIVETVDFSQDRGAVDRRLKAVAADPSFMKQYVHGRTTIYDALQSGLQLLHNPTSADALLIVTDGGDTGSKTSPDLLLAELSQTSTRVFSIMFLRRMIERGDPGEDTRVVKEFIDFVPRTGGDIFGPMLVNRSGQYTMINSLRTSKPLPQELAEFYKEMLNNDVVSLKTSAPFTKPIKLELRASPQSRKKWKDAVLLSPHQLGPCPTAPAL
jgi:hypothetical protein